MNIAPLKSLIFVLSFWGILSISASAQDTLHYKPVLPEENCFTIEIAASYGFGTTLYELNALTEDPRGGGEIVPIRSRLKFPLDGIFTGGNIIWHPGADSGKKWVFSLGILTNLTDPARKMINSDFVGGLEVIHTESDAILNFISGSIKIRYSLSKSTGTRLDLLFQTDYEHIKEKIIGYEGWQASLFTNQKYEISGTAPVLEYKLTYLSPRIGALVTHRIGSILQLGLEGTAGIVFASDLDNHTLRRRSSEGSGTGFGFKGGLTVELLPGRLLIESLSLSISADATYYRAEGKMDQTFPDGDQYRDIPYLFECVYGRIGLALRYSF